MSATITAVLGNIVTQPDCEAIVNSANANLRAGSGVCGAIYRAAGPELEPYSVCLAPLALAQAVETPGFKLSNRWIIHCRGPRYHFDPDPAENLARCLRNTLLLADRLGVKRLAVPAISMGVFAYPPEEAVPILVDAASAALASLASLEEVRFVLFDQALCERFQVAIDGRSGVQKFPAVAT